MALYVYITPECEEDAKRHGRYDEVLKLKDKVEDAQRVCHFDNFPPPYLKKRFDRQIRLLANYRTHRIEGKGEHVVVSFLRVYVRSGKEYRQFLRDCNKFGEKHLEPLVPDNVIRKYLKTQLAEKPRPPKPKPSEDENYILYNLLGGGSSFSTNEAFVCESELWVKMVQEEHVKQMLLHIYDELSGLIDDPPEGTRLKIRERYTLIYRWFPELSKLFLAGISDNSEDIKEIEDDYATILNEGNIDEEYLLRSSMRSYPGLLFADQDGWVTLQNDTESNLALSPEEVEVLESVHRHEQGFPVFINGRAGSGKSTILYYLFADYLNMVLDLKRKGTSLNEPVLFSCSNDLTKRARDMVSKFIECNPRWDGNDKPQIPDKCFREFHDYLLSLVPDEEKRIFSDGKYVDYARYRSMWNDQFKYEKKMVKEAGVDLSWHIIRTYIKGTSPEDYLEPEEYEHLPKKQKSVSRDAYETVYSKVWDNWYRNECEQNGYWDDQDLARYVFEYNLAKATIPAVFCDEAQDFTRVELDILFSLCLFADRTLGHADILRVPFAFAGDPFQTLNPTGFRWDAIQASFHDKLIDILGDNIHTDISINYRELNLNYRSTKNIVKFCNLIQSMRASLFDLPSLRPQQTWQYEKNSPFPVWFDKGNKSLWQNLEKERDVTIIIPCALNEEMGYVAKDKTLQKIVSIDDKGVPRNVLSPARAKGLEFNRVVLYSFADEAPFTPSDILGDDDVDRDQLLPYEYFVNQLYVAASRPKRRLFIIDSHEGREKLWKITKREMQHKLWGQISDGREVWENDVEGFQVGTEESWSEDRGDPQKDAESYEQQGLALRDPYLLRSAALSYKNLGNKEREYICRAKALNLEGEYSEAGDCYLDIGDAVKALQCYWRDGLKARDKIIDLGEKHPDIPNTIEYRVVHTLKDCKPTSILSLFRLLLEQSEEQETFDSRLGAESAFEAAIWNLASIYLQGKDLEGLPKLREHVENLVERGLPANHSTLGDLAYKLEDYEGAINHWDEVKDKSSSSEYQEAKAIQIAKIFRSQPSMELSYSQAKLVSKHFCDKNEYLLALKSLAANGNAEDLISRVSGIPQEYEHWNALFCELFELLASKGEWLLISDMCLTSRGKRVPSELDKMADKLKQNASIVRNAMIATCADSEQLPSQAGPILKNVSAYLSKELDTLDNWFKDVPLELAGAAIERAGRQADILPFYEKVLSDSRFKKQQIEFARIRWIVTKEKQAVREDKAGNKSRSGQYMGEALEARRISRIEDAKLDEYPRISKALASFKDDLAKRKIIKKKSTKGHKPVDKSSQQGEKPAKKTGSKTVDRDNIDTTISFGDLRLEFSPSRGRVNLTNQETMGQASILAKQKSFKSSDVQIRKNKGCFSCQDWGLKCSFKNDDQDLIVFLSHEERGLEISLHFNISEE